MRTKIKKYAKVFLSMMLSMIMILETWGGISFVSDAATSITTENGVIGTEFPSVPSGESWSTYWPSYDFSADEYYIQTVAQFVNFARASRSHTFAGKTIHLAANINYGTSSYASASFAGIGTVNYPFCGTFNGHGYTITGLYSKSTGMFLHIGSTDYPATIKNFTIDSANISGAEGKAVVVSRFSGNPKNSSKNNKIADVTVTNSTASFTGDNCGIIAGRCQSDNQAITITGCKVSNTSLICTASTTTNITQWGMIIGKDYSSGYSCISDCIVTGSSISSTNCNINRVGLVAGFLCGATQVDSCTVSSSSLTCGLSTATVTKEVGGIVGSLKSGYGKITNCSVSGTTITTKGLSQYVGLLAGHIYGGTIQSNTVSSSTINANYNASNAQASRIGGLIGNINSAPATISGCTVGSTTINNASRVNCIGGLIGNIESGAAGTTITDTSISDSYIYNKFSTSSAYSFYIGGAIGRSLGNITATNVDASNVVITAASLVKGAGCFAGYISGSTGSTISECNVNSCSLTTTAYNDTAGYECYHVSNFAGCVDTSSSIKNCYVDSTNVMTQGRTIYLGGLVGSTYSDSILTTPKNGAVTIYHCYVEDSKLETNLSRYCSKFGGLVGYLSEGSSVTNCYVAGLTGTKNTNSLHVGGLIGYIPNVSGSATTVKSCFVKDATLFGKNYLGETIGNCVATSTTLKALWHYNCTLTRGSSGSTYSCSGAKTGTATNFASGEAAWSLNTAAGSQSNTYIWTQGTYSPYFDNSSTLGVSRVTYQNPSGNVYRYTNASGYISSIPEPDTGYAWNNTGTYFNVDSTVTATYVGAAFPSSFSGTPSGEYYITTKQHLKNFQAASKNYDLSGVTINLEADIDWGGSAGGNWGGIGSGSDSNYAFCGTFNGNGHTISNLYSTSTGFFLSVGKSESPATIKDFTLKNATISGAEGKAVVVSRINGNPSNVANNTLISNVHVVDSTAKFSGNNCGVIVGRGLTGNDAVTITGCSVSGTSLTCTASTTTNIARWGLIIGRDQSNGYSRINNCTVKNSSITSTNCNIDYVGGIVGLINGSSQIDSCTVSGCSITTGLATSTVTKSIGGVVGQLQSGYGKVTNCTVTGTTITAKGLCQYVGLLAGHIYGGTINNNTVSSSTINTTYNASASQSSRIGGVIGNLSNTKAKISDCTATGITMNNASRVNSIGGFIGNIESAAAGTVIDNITMSNVDVKNTYSTNSAYSFYIGGAIGRSLGKVHVTNVSLDDVNITAASLVRGVGGFAGYITGSDPSVLTNCTVSNSTIKQTQTALDDTYKCYHVAGFVGCVDSDSKFASCAISSVDITMQGRTYYLGGLIGSTYSDTIQTTAANGMITVKNCAVDDCVILTSNSRNCNEFGGLIGWLSEGGTVTDCYVSGVTNPSNTNSCHVGGLIGYISETTTSSVSTTVKNCYVQKCTLRGKNSISATIGNAVASGEVFKNIYYYNCTLSGGTESNASGASKVTTTSNLTNGTLVTSLNTTANTTTNSNSWAQGSVSPVLSSSRKGYTEAKVMSFNVYWKPQYDSYPITSRQTKVINFMKSYANQGVGVFGLQEVSGDWYSYIKGFVDSTNFVWYGVGRYGGTFGGFASGSNATNDQFALILYDTTKYTKTDSGYFWLSDTPSYKSYFYDVAYNYRVANWVRLRDKTTGEEFVFVNAHLEQTQSSAITNGAGYTIDSSDAPIARIRQAQLICDQIEQNAPGVPVVIVGDWNSYAGTDGYSTFIDNGYQDLREIAEDADTCGTYTAWTRTDPTKFSKGDHIVASAQCTATLYDVLYEEDVDSASGYHLSDHTPMLGVIRY